MKIVLLGAQGQLGAELHRSLVPLGKIIPLSRQSQPWVNFEDLSKVTSFLRKFSPDVIVNAVAYTSVDKAESENRRAILVNTIAPGILAECAAELGAWLVHYSTDYVFDGCGNKPWKEDDIASPLNEYGRSKLAGEEKIRISGCNYLIFRTSWLYAVRGTNFAKTILQRALAHNILKVVNDQFGVPTSASLVADITAHALRAAVAQPQLRGTYHVVPSGVTTWYHYAKFLLDRAHAAGLPVKGTRLDLQAIASTEYPYGALRPANSRLDTSKLQNSFGLHLPDWKSGVDHFVIDLLKSQVV